MEAKKAELGTPPAIDFWNDREEETAKEEADDYLKNKSAYTTIAVPLNLNGKGLKEAITYDHHVKIFKGGTAEEYCYLPYPSTSDLLTRYKTVLGNYYETKVNWND